jgi:hypothetical protein
MLKAPAGATIDAMMKATGWQQHSVRGFLAGPPKNRIVRFSGLTGTDVRVAQEGRDSPSGESRLDRRREPCLTEA